MDWVVMPQHDDIVKRQFLLFQVVPEFAEWTEKSGGAVNLQFNGIRTRIGRRFNHLPGQPGLAAVIAPDFSHHQARASLAYRVASNLYFRFERVFHAPPLCPRISPRRVIPL